MSDSAPSGILSDVAEYYSAKLGTHGSTPQGVDWNGEVSQQVRFEQLARIITRSEKFSLNDLGCGYGALYEYLNTRYRDFSYSGCDISIAMIAAARARNGKHPGVRYVAAAEPSEPADYGIASGVFNVRLGHNDDEWLAYLKTTLDVLHRSSRFGFAFNCLTSYSDADRKRDYLYYADPCALFDHCKKHYSRHVALLHDYGLYEFTILVRKDL